MRRRLIYSLTLEIAASGCQKRGGDRPTERLEQNVVNGSEEKSTVATTDTLGRSGCRSARTPERRRLCLFANPETPGAVVSSGAKTKDELSAPATLKFPVGVPAKAEGKFWGTTDACTGCWTDTSKPAPNSAAHSSTRILRNPLLLWTPVIPSIIHYYPHSSSYSRQPRSEFHIFRSRCAL